MTNSLFFSANHNSINQPSVEQDILVNPEDIKREIVTYYYTEIEEGEITM